MDIISAQYAEGGGTINVVTDEGDKSVPDNMSNRHRRVLQEWVDADEANIIEPYATPPIYETEDQAKAAMISWADDFTNGITGLVPDNEKHSWGNKNTLPQKFADGTISADELALLDAEILFTGETLQELIDKISSNAHKYALIASMMAGLRRKTNALLEAETDPHQYQVILQSAQASAIDALASLENV